MSDELCEVSVVGHGGAVVAHLRGELDVSNVEHIESQVEEAFGPAPGVVDLSGTTFLDSSALHWLHRIGRRAREHGRPLSIVAPDGSAAERLLRFADPESRLPTDPTLDDALRRVGAAER